ncbi:Hypothetical predicted protein, partial [Olea europaea subsp. europaea]
MAKITMQKRLTLFMAIVLLCYIVHPVSSISNNNESNDLLLGARSRWHGAELEKQPPAVAMNREEPPFKKFISTF